MGNQSLLLPGISEDTASACYSSKEQVQLKHGTQAAATGQPKFSAPPLCPSLQLSTSITGVGKTTERFKKLVFSCWHPCQAATESESGWSLSQNCRGISIRECKLYAMLTTETRESITNLPKLHKALSTQTSPPYTSTGTSVPTAKSTTWGFSTAHLPSTAQVWASYPHNYQALSQVWLHRHSTAGAV